MTGALWEGSCEIFITFTPFLHVSMQFLLCYQLLKYILSNKYHVVNWLRDVESQLHAILTSNPDGCLWLVHTSAAFSRGKNSPVLNSVRGWAERRTILDVTADVDFPTFLLRIEP
jgi:hypothetical protein